MTARRFVEPLSETRYKIHQVVDGGVILRCGKEYELWVQVEIPRKGYAILMDGQEYEFCGVSHPLSA